MSNLGLGLTAANAYFQEGERLADRAKQDQRFDWERQRAEAGLSILPDQTRAAQSGYQNTTDQNEAAMQVRPGQTANTMAEQQQTAYGLGRAAERQPYTEDLKDQRTGIDTIKTKAEVEALPGLLKQQKQKGVFDEAAATTQTFGALAKLVQLGDNNAIVKFMNDMDAIDDDPADRFPAPVAKVGRVPNPDDPNDELFVATDANGNVLQHISMTKLRQLAEGPGGFEKLKGGETLVRTDSRGNAVPVYTAPEDATTKASKMGPLERDVNYLVRGQNMSNEQALDYLKSAKTMSRDQFVLKALSDKVASGFGKQPTAEDIKAFGEMYDRATGKTPTAAPGAAPASAPAGAPAPAAAAGGKAPSIYDVMGLPR